MTTLVDSDAESRKISVRQSEAWLRMSCLGGFSIICSNARIWFFDGDLRDPISGHRRFHYI